MHQASRLLQLGTCQSMIATQLGLVYVSSQAVLANAVQADLLHDGRGSRPASTQRAL